MESDDVRMVGIYGMGGIGKTTIAKAFYNSAFHLFEGCCFLSNVREVSEQPNGLVRLQEQLLSEILKEKKFKVANDHIGITFIKERLCRKRVLIILDDVDQLSQLETLAGQRHWFGLGSRIIITTRNEHLLSQAKVDVKYEAEELNDDESLRLFSCHAFQKPIPLELYNEVSSRIVSYARGLPLALEVLGSSLLGRTTKEWDFTLKRLQKIPPNQILQKLRISFDLLDDENVKDIFLDIACFFIGMKKEYAINIFDDCGFFPGIGITILIERCLLTIDSANELRMHDLVRDMGREIVREVSPENRTRLFGHDAWDVLRKHQGSEAIEGVAVDLSTQMNLSTDAFARMNNLRLLQMKNVHLNGNFRGLFKELRWLCWPDCRLKCLPSEFHPEKLIFLKMQYSKLNILWKGIKFLTNLKSVDFSYSEFLTTTPDFTGVPVLQELSFEECPSLLEVHPSIGCLNMLIELNFGGCENLRSLPSSICDLTSLEKLHLFGCSNLKELPEQLGEIKSLCSLSLQNYGIRQLPDSVGFLKNLTVLAVNKCNRGVKTTSRFSFFPFRMLPESLRKTRFLPPSIFRMNSLQHLSLSSCNLSDGDIPDDLSGLSSLKILGLDGNSFCSLPSSLMLLSSLKILALLQCRSLQSILGLPPNLTSILARDCTSLVELPDVSNLKCLRRLQLQNCSSLVKIQGVEKLKLVSSISLDGCSNLGTTFENNFFQGYSGRGYNCNITLSKRKIPEWFEYKSIGGSLISFEVPLDVDSKFVEIALWCDFVRDVERTSGDIECNSRDIERKTRDTIQAVIKNKTYGTQWTHVQFVNNFAMNYKVISWMSHGPPSHPIKSGNRIEISFQEVKGYAKVENCGVHLVYIKKADMEAVQEVSGVISKRGRNVYSVETGCVDRELSKRLKS